MSRAKAEIDPGELIEYGRTGTMPKDQSTLAYVLLTEATEKLMDATTNGCSALDFEILEKQYGTALSVWEAAAK